VDLLTRLVLKKTISPAIFNGGIAAYATRADAAVRVKPLGIPAIPKNSP
jgi:hypothetical protein